MITKQQGLIDNHKVLIDNHQIFLRQVANLIQEEEPEQEEKKDNKEPGPRPELEQGPRPRPKRPYKKLDNTIKQLINHNIIQKREMITNKGLAKTIRKIADDFKLSYNTVKSEVRRQLKGIRR